MYEETVPRYVRTLAESSGFRAIVQTLRALLEVEFAGTGTRHWDRSRRSTLLNVHEHLRSIGAEVPSGHRRVRVCETVPRER